MTQHISLPIGTTTACELPESVTLYDGINVLQLTFILTENEDRSTEYTGVPPPCYVMIIHFVQKNL